MLCDWTRVTDSVFRGAELGEGGGEEAFAPPPCFGDLFDKFWGIFENSFFAIYCRPP